jgi:hypothetical protein
MMKGRVEPFGMLTMVRVMLIVVQAVIQTTTIPHMISPQESQLRE